MSTDGVLAAAFIPDDGYLDPSQLTFSLADAARRVGAQIETRMRVTGIETTDGRVVAVETDKGRIECEVVVERRRHVRARGRAHGRRRPADHPVRPPVPDHRAVRTRRSSRCRRCATPTTSSTSAPRSAAS